LCTIQSNDGLIEIKVPADQLYWTPEQFLGQNST
jgi:hypothetical protein